MKKVKKLEDVEPVSQNISQEAIILSFPEIDTLKQKPIPKSDHSFTTTEPTDLHKHKHGHQTNLFLY